MYYTVYKVTNTVNGKYYIGMHQTNDLDDGYMGSGSLIRKAIKKYGIDSFTKEILFVFDNEQDMKEKEKELVVVNEHTYNLCDGGKGGWGHINRNGINVTGVAKRDYEAISKKVAETKNTRTYTVSEDTKVKMRQNNWAKLDPEAQREHVRKIGSRPKSEEHRRKISESIKAKWAEKNAGIV